MRALTLVQLDGLATRPAPMLSGGQQQRVALARAIASEPAVLLLDEPLSNLDARLREDMRHEIKTLVRRLETTTLYVTHDQLEALSMSDRVALVNNGAIVQEGAPRDVYLRPADAFAANFLGRTNLLDGRVAGRQPRARSKRSGASCGVGCRACDPPAARLPSASDPKASSCPRARRRGRPARQDRDGELRRRRGGVPDRPGRSETVAPRASHSRARGRPRRAGAQSARTLLRALETTAGTSGPSPFGAGRSAPGARHRGAYASAAAIPWPAVTSASNRPPRCRTGLAAVLTFAARRRLWRHTRWCWTRQPRGRFSGVSVGFRPARSES